MTANPNNPTIPQGTYTPLKRKVEIASIIGMSFLWVQLLLWSIQEGSFGATWTIAIAVFLGYLAADFGSGMVHWLADTWGTLKTPLWGNSIIRTFREHHIDPKAITTHGFVETNGDNCLVSAPFVLISWILIWLKVSIAGYYAVFTLTLTFFGIATNQIHKWSHLDDNPKWIVWLQKSGLIISKAKHDLHHRRPFNSHFCITSGILNRPLKAIRYFETLEWIVHKFTGNIPRSDDVGMAEAVAIFQKKRKTSSKA